MNLSLRYLLFYSGIMTFLFGIVKIIKKFIIGVSRKFVNSLEALWLLLKKTVKE